MADTERANVFRGCRVSSSSGPQSPGSLQYVHSFDRMLYKCMVTVVEVVEYLLFTESDQNFLVTSLCLGKYQ